MQKEYVIKNMKISLIALAAAVVLAAVGDLFPFGERLLLMQLPVLLCGFLCGAPFGAAVGMLTPFLSFLLRGTPAFYPDAVAMSAEYLLFGAMASPIFRGFAKSTVSIYASLFVAMAAGRVGWAAAEYIMVELAHRDFHISALLHQEILAVWPGILLQLAAVPLLVMAADRAGLIEDV